MKIISVSNSKGGVAKTTTTLNLGAALAARGARVLMVDLDPQASLTLYCGIDPGQLTISTYDIMTRRSNALNGVKMTAIPSLDLLPACVELATAELEISGVNGRELILKEQLDTLYRLYDVVLIDNMPSLGILPLNSLMASDYVIVPLEPTHFAYKGLQMMNMTIEEVRKYHTNLRLLGVIVTMVDDRTKHTREIIGQIRENYTVLGPLIRRSIRFSDAAAANQPISQFAGPDYEGSRAYAEIAAEIHKLL